jgi:formyl-CoA transferase
MYTTADGYLNLAAPWGRLWSALCDVLERPALATDPRFIGPSERAAHREALNAEITAALASRTTTDWVERLNEAGIPAGPVNDIAETFADPQVKHLGIATPITHPSVGEIEILRNATRIEGISGRIRRPAPEAGEHTSEILREFGLDSSEIEALRSAAII